MGNLNICELLN